MQFLNFLKKQLLSDLVFVYAVYFELWIRALRKLKFFIKMLLENFNIYIYIYINIYTYIMIKSLSSNFSY